MIESKVLNHIKFHSVYNDSGSLLIYTTNGRIARFVEAHTPGADPNLRLRVGGDPGTRNVKQPGIWIRIATK